MERVAVGINTGVYDLDVYARICRGKTVDNWRRLEPIVIQRRKQEGIHFIKNMKGLLAI